MNSEARIKLAEAMGWKRNRISTVKVMGRPYSVQRWLDPAGKDRSPLSLPDPFTDANDCEAVILWLNSKGYQVVINHLNASHNGVTVSNQCNKGEFFESAYEDDWKQGVCELALKVLEQANEQ